MTALEAMACGTPTVVTTASGMKEQLEWGEQCMFADPNDAAEFGMAISNLLTYNEPRHRLIEGGSRYVKNFYTWRLVAEQMECIYKGLE
jgi:mannosylfructose-phosphate synthase